MATPSPTGKSPPMALRVPPPETGEPLASLATRAGGRSALLVEPTPLFYALPTHAEAEVLAYLRPLATASLAPLVSAELPAARVFGAGAVLSADGRQLATDVSLDFGKPAEDHWLLENTDLRPPESLPGPSAVVAVNLGAGYCHWLLEELPRLLQVPPGSTSNLILHAAPPYARSALTRRGGAERVVEARRNGHFACAPLLVPALIGRPGLPTPAALALIDAFTEPLGREPSPLGERLYFSREKTRRRRVANESALWALLAPLGFVRIHLEDLSWEEQIAACRKARVVVAPHGAGLANLAFCQPGTRVVELVHRAYFNPTFWRLAALRGHDYRPVLAPGDCSLGVDRRANRLDLEADCAAVRAALLSS